MEVARGHVGDRPFARTVYTIAAKRFTGDLVLTQEGRTYKISWEDGGVVAAESPAPADQEGRIALTAGLVDTTTVSESLKLLATNPGSSQLEILASLGRLTPEQTVSIKKRTLAARAARVFALDSATFVLNNARSMSADPEVPPLDVRWLINFGVRSHYQIERLQRETAAVRDRPVRIAPDALAAIDAFGFGGIEKGLLARLMERALTLPEMALAFPDLDQHTLLSVVYALVACDCLTIEEQRRPAPAAGAGVAPAPRPAAPPPPAPQTAASGTPPPTLKRKPAAARAVQNSAVKIPGLRRGEKITADDVRELIARKARTLEQRGSFYELMDISPEAKRDDIRLAYFQLAKRLHPDRLHALQLQELLGEAQRVFAHINQAFNVLSHPVKALEYRKELQATVDAAQHADAIELASRLFAAEEHFRKGEMALRRSHFAEAEAEFERALELNPDDAEHIALHAWASWCAAPDKAAVAKKVNKQLSRAIATTPNSVPAWFYRGLVSKQRGLVEIAIECFTKVLALEPNHHEAEQELRLLRSRDAAPVRPDDRKGGGLFKRK